MRKLALLLVACAGLACQAQTKGTVRLLVQPWKRVAVRVDEGQPLRHISEVSLNQGLHRLRFWAEAFTMWDTTLNIEPGKAIELRRILKHDQGHVAFLEQRAAVWRKKMAWIAAPAAVAVGGGVWSLINKKAHDDAYDHLHALADSYHTDNYQGSIATLKEVLIPEAEQELDATRSRLVTSLFVGGLGLAATVYGVLRARRYGYPSYEDKERGRFEGVAWLPGDRGGMWMAGLTIHLR